MFFLYLGLGLEVLEDFGFSEGVGDSFPQPRKRDESISKGTKRYLFFMKS